MTLEELLDRANCGIIGIDSDLNVFGGYDEPFGQCGEKPDWLDDEDFDAMPPDQRIALADRMIELWQRYKDAV